MKVLQIINSLGTGGAEKLLLDSIPLYRKAGVEMDLLVFWDHDLPFLKELEKQHCCKIYVLSKSSNFRSIYNPMHILRMRRIMQQYDIAHVHLFPAQYYAVFANLLNGLFNKKKIPLVFTEHNTANRRIAHKNYRWIEGLIYRQYAVHVCITQEIKSIYDIYLGHPGTRTVIGNGVDVDKYAEAKALKKTVFCQDDDFLLIQVSGFREQKDQPTLIRSLAYLPAHIKLLLAGDGSLRSFCEDLTQELGLQQRVQFLGIRTDIPQLLKTADVVVLSSIYEGLSLSSIEGMAARPFVASDVPGLHETVNGYGLLFPQGDAKALAAQIIKLYEDKGFYRQIAEQCLGRAQEFDIHHMIQQYIAVYKGLIKSD